MMLRMLLALLPFLAYFAEGEGDNDPDPDPDPDPKDPPKFTEAQQEAINRIVAKEKAKAAEKARADRDAELAAEKAKAEADAKLKADEDAGEFEKVKEALIKERDDAASNATAIQKERDELLKLVKVDVDTAWEGLPAEVRDAYEGDADDALARKAHMQKMQKIIDRLAGAAGSGNPRPPKPDDGSFDLEAEKQKAKAQVGAKF